MSITDKKGINVTSGFKLISPQPIDARMVVEDENELASIVDSAAAYEGQLVYVKSLDKYVSFDGTQFNELETGGGGGAYVEGETLYLNAAESGSSSGSTGGGSKNITYYVDYNNVTILERETTTAYAKAVINDSLLVSKLIENSDCDYLLIKFCIDDEEIYQDVNVSIRFNDTHIFKNRSNLILMGDQILGNIDYWSREDGSGNLFEITLRPSDTSVTVEYGELLFHRLDQVIEYSQLFDFSKYIQFIWVYH